MFIKIDLVVDGYVTFTFRDNQCAFSLKFV